MPSRKDRSHARPDAVRNPGTQPRAVKGLIDAKALAKKHPNTFFVPKDALVKKLKPGDFVKVARNNERFWLRLTGWVGKRWHGTVANHLINNDDLAHGDAIFFTKKNIYDVLPASKVKNPGKPKTSKTKRDLAETWLESFVEAAGSGADCETAKAIAWAKVKRVSNPRSTWKMTPTGRYRARLGSLPDKWKSEWVRRYKSALKKQQTRKGLNESQQKTIAAKQAWDAIKKQGCRLPKSVRPSARKSVYKSPNKRARDRSKYQGWVCPEWESTEKAREKIIKDTIRESEQVEKRERARRKKQEREIKRRQKLREDARKRAKKTAEKEEKARRKKQTAREYSEEFRKKHGARGLLPTRKRKKT